MGHQPKAMKDPTAQRGEHERSGLTESIPNVGSTREVEAVPAAG